MALLTSTEVRTHVETGLVDAALQRIMDAAEEDIDQKFGAVSSQVDDLEGKLKSVWTTRPISSITSVVETLGTDDTTLAGLRLPILQRTRQTGVQQSISGLLSWM